MPTAPTMKSSALSANRQSVTHTYIDRFNDLPPRGVHKFAVDSGQSDKLYQMLQEQIDKGEPVKDWESFAESLYAPYRAKQAAPESNSRA